MKKLLTLLLLCGSAWAQGNTLNANTTTKRFAGAPSGSCSVFMYAVNNATNDFYGCDSTTHNWVLISTGGGSPVTSVFGRTGAVVATSGDYGLGLIGNPAAGTSFSYASNQTSIWNLLGTGYFGITNLGATPATTSLRFSVDAVGRGNLNLTDSGTGLKGAILFDADGGLVLNPLSASTNKVTLNNTGLIIAGGTASNGACTPDNYSLKVAVHALFQGNSSGSIGVKAADVAGTNCATIPAVTGTFAVAATSATATQALFATTTAGAPAYRAVATTDLPSNSNIRGIPFTIGTPGGSALTVASTTTDYITVPFACTIAGYNLLIDAGTITVKFWKIATGTAIPTSSNSISTSGVGISSGTAIHSTTVSDFTTTTVTANDIMAMNVTAVATAAYVQGVLQCNQ